MKSCESLFQWFGICFIVLTARFAEEGEDAPVMVETEDLDSEEEYTMG